MDDIDDMMRDNEEEERLRNKSSTNSDEESTYKNNNTKNDEDDDEENSNVKGKILIGRVEKFFSKINVAAIELQGDLKVGDTIEIEDEDGSTIIKVSSMQIEKEDVQEASEGSSVGIKVKVPVKEGSNVYLVN